MSKVSQESSEWPPRITVDPEVCNGKPTIRGKRISVQTILEFLSAGNTEKEILDNYPTLTPEDIQACRSVAARLLDHRYVIRKTA